MIKVKTEAKTELRGVSSIDYRVSLMSISTLATIPKEGELTDDENVPDPNASKMDTETPTLDEENPDATSFLFSERPIMGKYMFLFLI